MSCLIMFFKTIIENLKSKWNHFNDESKLIDDTILLIKRLSKEKYIIGLCIIAFLFFLVFSLLVSLFLDLSVCDAAWWVWMHLIDQGFVADDVGIKAKILGTLLVICQMFFY